MSAGPRDRPQWTPDWRLTVGGADISATVRPLLLSLSVTDHLDADSDELELRLDWRDRAIALPRRGAVIRLALGWKETGLVDMPGFVVDEVQYGNEAAGLALALRGRAADLRGPLRAPRTRSLEAPTLGDLVARVAADNGLTPVVASALAGLVVGHVDQSAESDLHLVARHARAAGASVKVADGRLVVSPVGAGTSAGSGRPLAATIREDEATTWWVTVQDREAASSVAAPYHDLDTAETVWEVVEGGGDGPPVEVRHGAATPDQARARATGAAQDSGRGGSTLRLSLEGRPTLGAGGDITLSGFGPADGRWSLKSVTHTLDTSGFRTEVEAETPPPPTIATGAATTSPGAAAVPGWRVVEDEDGIQVVYADGAPADAAAIVEAAGA
ncbi:phage late control D family protein [Roseospira visakhapatnamensis]|uniref:Late control gene D protein (GPD) n=1 Tax=Roseospira visakhapatnamensis TaxID=390880 RepID=A0A7W6RE50_9PROT|nr:contractile injection system protein, VgrG/Pvc8 family [Roseospira visakhapatnamensis]MBB4266876.1 hypothetical protein [Roseospira visakhapatnamensis]